jgi:hypothetical protein
METTIDHFLPESLLADNNRRIEVLNQHGLTNDFNINGFENWLPCHSRCNQAKGNKTFEYVPGNMIVLQKLIKFAPKVKRTALEVSSDANKDKLFGEVFAALEKGRVSQNDLKELFSKLVEEPAPIPNDVLLLENGRWIFRSDIARECDCCCERNVCVDSKGKVHCYFSPDISPWVINTGLYWKCYDEVIVCPRCHEKHKRGHIGKEGKCGIPYRNQETQSD